MAARGAVNTSPGRRDVPWTHFEQMVKPTLLLKFVRRGDAHFREFRVSMDLEYLSWWSPNKKKDETRSAQPSGPHGGGSGSARVDAAILPAQSH